MSDPGREGDGGFGLRGRRAGDARDHRGGHGRLRRHGEHGGPPPAAAARQLDPGPPLTSASAADQEESPSVAQGEWSCRTIPVVVNYDAHSGMDC